MGSTTKIDEEIGVEEILSLPYKIILHNDDFNSFDHVIECLIKICGHEPEQACQNAHQVHFKGESDVKYGHFEELSAMNEKLQNSGLCSTLETN